MKTRSPWPPQIQLAVKGFYGGYCVVNPNVVGSLHHLDGDPDRSSFVNAAPLTHSLHAGLRTKPPRWCAEAHGVLDPFALRSQADALYRGGKTVRAFACARLAHSIRRYFREKRCFEEELHSLGDALHYLRRVMINRPDQGYALFEDIVDRELIPTISTHPSSLEIKIKTIEEMAAWLNEFGQSAKAKPILGRVEQLSSRGGFSNQSLSGYLRQRIFCLVDSGANPEEVDRALCQARDEDDSTQNEFGLAIAEALRSLLLGDGRSGLKLLEPAVHKAVKEVLNKELLPERIGCRYENFVTLLGVKLLAVATSKIKSSALENLVAEQAELEIRLGCRVRFTQDVQHALNCNGHVEQLQTYLSKRVLPCLSSPIVDRCENVVRILVSKL